MTDRPHLPQRNDPVECRFPLGLKAKPEPCVAKPADLPPELQFVANAHHPSELAPLIRVFQKHPHIREAVVTALREG